MKTVCEDKLAKAVKNINHRPRKCLNYKTPDEVLGKYLSGALAT